MSPGAWIMAAVMAMILGILVFLTVAMIRSIGNERSKGRSVWKQFSLGLVLMILFLGTWVGHGVTEWQRYTDEQRAVDQPIAVGDFVAEFSSSTLENWQSEFLQLFSFVVLAALYIHKGSAESRDGGDRLEASLRRIEEKLGTLPSDAPKAEDERWKLPDPPLKVAG